MSCTTLGKSIGFSIASFALALIFILCAVLIPHYINDKLDEGIDDMLVLTPEKKASKSDGWLLWQDYRDPKSFPLTVKIYVFDVLNPLEVMAGQAPYLVERGPYVFKEYRVRFDTSFNWTSTPVGGRARTLAFREWQYYVFDRAATPSHLNPNDNITTLNMQFQTLKSVNPFFAYNFFKGFSDYDKMFMKRSVTDVVFGFSSTDSLSFLPWVGFLPNTTSTDGVDPGFSVIYTGEGDGSDEAKDWAKQQMRQYSAWEGSQEVQVPSGFFSLNVKIPPWGSKQANRISGTDAAQFASKQAEGGRIRAYVDTLYRMAELANLNNQHETYAGIDLLKFTLPDDIMANATVNPKNADFYMTGLPSAILNLTATSLGVPIFVSKPHFLDVPPAATSYLINKVQGLSPNSELHDTFLSVEPLTGTTMRARKRLQLNVKVSPVYIQDPASSFNTTWLPFLTEFMFPTCWIEEGGDIPDDKAADFRDQVYGAQNWKNRIRSAGWVLGFLFLAVGLYMVYRAHDLNREQQELQMAVAARYQHPVNGDSYVAMDR